MGSSVSWAMQGLGQCRVVHNAVSYAIQCLRQCRVLQNAVPYVMQFLSTPVSGHDHFCLICQANCAVTCERADSTTTTAANRSTASYIGSSCCRHHSSVTARKALAMSAACRQLEASVQQFWPHCFGSFVDRCVRTSTPCAIC